MTLGLEAGSSGRPAAHPPPQGCVGTVWGRRGPAPREGRPADALPEPRPHTAAGRQRGQNEAPQACQQAGGLAV